MTPQRHTYIFDPKVVDTAKARADAVRHSRGDERNPPEVVMIHWHDSREWCEGFKHELYVDEEIVK